MAAPFATNQGALLVQLLPTQLGQSYNKYVDALRVPTCLSVLRCLSIAITGSKLLTQVTLSPWQIAQFSGDVIAIAQTF